MRLLRAFFVLVFTGLLAAAAARAVAPLPVKPDLVVALDGTGDFTSVHDAAGLARLARTLRLRR